MNYSDNQKLIRCHLARAESAQQTRFIEFELFKLWQYMMQTKYGFEVSVSEGRTVEKGQVSGLSEISLGLSND